MKTVTISEITNGAKPLTEATISDDHDFDNGLLYLQILEDNGALGTNVAHIKKFHRFTEQIKAIVFSTPEGDRMIVASVFDGGRMHRSMIESIVNEHAWYEADKHPEQPIGIVWEGLELRAADTASLVEIIEALQP